MKMEGTLLYLPKDVKRVIQIKQFKRKYFKDTNNWEIIKEIF